MEEEKRLYSILESYRILYDGMRTIKYSTRAKKNGEITSQFTERIMLAVTEVNDCAACSFVHTKMALETGMDSEEIQRMLSGSFDNIPQEQLQAVLFAQHYADSNGHPSEKAWEKVIAQYGESKALGILGTIRMIMMGNVYGIVLGSFVNRFKGKPDSRSNIFYEILMMVSALIFMPVVFIHVLIASLLHIPIIFFEGE